MSNATLSAENRIRERMQSLGMSAAFLAAISGVEATRLSLAFRGIRDLSNDDAKKLLSITEDLVTLSEAAKPFALPGDVPSMTRILKHLRGRNEEVETTIATLFRDAEE
jgi:transcriptional regulator with XRE-family HTH domain